MRKNRKNITRILCLALALMFLCSCSAPRIVIRNGAVKIERPGKTAETTVETETDPSTMPAGEPAAETEATPGAEPATETESAPTTQTVGDGIHREVNYADMTWSIPDTAEYDARLEEFKAAEGEESVRIYQELLEAYFSMSDDEALAMVVFYSDVSNEEASKAQEEISKITLDAGDRLLAAVAEVLNSERGDALRAYLGDEQADSLALYEAMDQELKDMYNRETELVNEYNTLIADTELSEEELNQQCGEIFLQLIELRKQIAEAEGYDSYADYAYTEVFGRDYTPEEAVALCLKVAKIAPEYVRNCYFCSAFYEDWGDEESITSEDTVRAIQMMSEAVSYEAKEAADFLLRNGLYLPLEGENVAETCFTIDFPGYRSALIFQNFFGDFMYNLSASVHEFGHFYDSYLHPQCNDPLDGLYSYDLMEIHSTGLEALLDARADAFFNDALEYAHISTIDNLFISVIEGCLYDEFLQYCFSEPELTIEDINTEYYLLVLKYYGYDLDWPEGTEYGWMYVNHNFESPFYYISYATSALASMQIWELAQSDWETAAERYDSIVKAGRVNVSYCKVLEEAGLKLFTEDLDGILKPCYKAACRLCMDYEEAHG